MNRACGRAAFIALITAALVAQSCGCLRKPTVSTDTRDSVRIEYRDRYREQVRRDTTYVRDSVFIRDRGDTVLVYRDRYHYTDRFLRDTVRTTDTVYQTVNRDRVVVEVQKHVPTLYRWSLYVALAALTWIAFTVWRRISGRR